MRRFSALALVAAIAVAGCADESITTTTQPEGGGQTASGPASGPAPNTTEYFNQVVGDRVFFATDRYDLNPLSQATLQRQAQWLQSNPAASVTIEGHADERGTRQYNLGLGARRANSVRDHLISLGVDASRLDTVTFGKERPVALCSNESCWSQNRRGVSVVAGGPTS